MKLQNCIVCKSEKLIPVANFPDSNGGSIDVAINLKPNALIFKKTRKESVMGRLCCECGYVHMFVSYKPFLEERWNDYQSRQQNQA